MDVMFDQEITNEYQFFTVYGHLKEIKSIKA